MYNKHKIKIALIGHFPNIEKMNSFTNLWSCYLPDALINIGVEVTRIEVKPHEIKDNKRMEEILDGLDVSGFEHVIALGLRFFSITPREATKRLRARVSGCLGHIYDGGMLDSHPVDLTFTIRNDDWLYPPGSPNSKYSRHIENNKYIGWAADEKLLTPKQDEKVLRILIDHTSFNATQKDQTLTVLLNVKNLLDKKELWGKFEDIKVKMIHDGGVNDIDLSDIMIKPYSRKSIPFKEIAKEYSKSHIFMPTHYETVGLTMLETAMAGNLVVCPKGFAPVDRLETIRHIETDGEINWSVILKEINPTLSSSVAKKNSWETVARRLIAHLLVFQKK